MALCCIGGVCIPYTAIVPFLVLGLKWIFEKLVAIGLIPVALQEKATALFLSSSSSTACCNSNSTVAGNGSTKLRRGKKTTNTAYSDLSASSCCTTESSTSSMFSDNNNGPKKNVIFVKSLDEWNSIVHNNNNTNKTVICKMTASWCKPCKVIQPIFEELATIQNTSKNNKAVIFCVVDVDELDQVAAKYRVAMLPTFLVMKNDGKEVDRYSGSNEQKLRDLVASAVLT